MDDLDRLRQRDDVGQYEETFELDAESFAEARDLSESEAKTSVAALVRDDDGRVALVRNHWSDGWVLPGGKVEPGESLRRALVREVREEIGVDVTVERPLAVSEQEFRHGDESLSGYFAVFETRADDPSLGDDLGEDDAEIEAAGWFREVPEPCENADLLNRYL